MSYMKHIIACNRHNLATFKPFEVDGVTIGHVRPALAAEMTKYPEIFVASERNLTFTGTLIGFKRRCAAMARVVADLVKSGLLPPERGEFYPVAAAFSEEPFFQLDRGAISAFGIRAFGVHVNGFIRHDNGAIEMWIARRAKDRIAYPSMLDNMVAGGQPHVPAEAAQSGCASRRHVTTCSDTKAATRSAETAPSGSPIDGGAGGTRTRTAAARRRGSAQRSNRSSDNKSCRASDAEARAQRGVP